MEEINKDEFFDELQKMGVKFTDETVPAQMPEMERKPIGPGTQKKSTKLVEKTACPFPKAPKGFMDKLMGCATWAMICRFLPLRSARSIRSWWRSSSLGLSASAP